MKLNIYDYSLTNILNDNLLKLILSKQNYSTPFINQMFILKR